MAESPIFIAENMGALMTLSGTAGDTGYPLSSLVDNLHYTSYKVTSAFTLPIYFDPSGTPTVDCVIIDALFTDAAGYYEIGTNGIIKSYTPTGITPGVRVYTFTPFAIVDNLKINVVSTVSPKQFRHIWTGIQLPVKAPVAPFDPEKVMQPKNQFFARSGVMTKQSPIYTKKLLEMEINNISATDYTNLLALYNKSFLKGLPFWYFLKPTSQPTMGYLYEWDQDEFDLSYLKDGTHRRCSIRAIADYSPDRTTAAL